jgi:hypothetical protein
MIARGFKPVAWVAAVGGAALGCYMVSLQVATERNKLGSVERQIIATKQEIRSLQTELGTRGRLSQLERWNAEVLALSAPASGQYLKDAFTLAQFEQRQPTYEEKAKVTLASADAAPVSAAPAQVQAAVQPQVRMAVAAAPPPVTATVHQASFTTLAPVPAVAQPAKPKPKPVVKQAQVDAPAAKPVKPAIETAQAKPAAPQAKPRKPSLDSLSASLADAARSEAASRKGTR